MRVVWIAVAATTAARAGAEPPAPPPAAADGLQWRPGLSWREGDHRVDLTLSSRARFETWAAFTDQNSGYWAVRTRVRLQYSWRDQFLAVGEFQDVRLQGMNSGGTGALAVYRSANDGRSHAAGDALRALYLEGRPIEKSFLRVGRQDVKLGSQEVEYPEPNWRYLKGARLGERMVGTVGWSHVERAYDGFAGGVDLGGYTLFGFGAHPTQGVFEADRGYHPLDDIAVGGGSLTVNRGTWLEHDEFGVFGFYYQDDRPVSHGGLAHPVEVSTYGAHWLGVHPVGPGNLDVLAWAALQTGTYNRLDQNAAAGIVEVGYQLPEVFAKPWLRVGVNLASGDDDPSDGDHDTFFNGLPTNHLYYGFADQLAFQNLQDAFVQLRLAPHPMLALNFFFHHFQLLESNDARYAGTGAFDEKVFGYPGSPANGHRNVGNEYDVVATLTPVAGVILEGGFAWLDGGPVFRTAADRDVQFGYVSITLKY